MINCWCFHPSCGVRVVAASSENFWWWSAAGAVVVDDGVPVARSIVTSHSMEEEMAPPPPRSVGRVLLRTKRKKEPPTQKVFTNLEKLDKCGRLRTPRAARELALWVLVPFTPPPPWVGFCVFFPKLSEIWLQIRKKKIHLHLSVQRVWELLNFWFFSKFLLRGIIRVLESTGKELIKLWQVCVVCSLCLWCPSSQSLWWPHKATSWYVSLSFFLYKLTLIPELQETW